MATETQTDDQRGEWAAGVYSELRSYFNIMGDRRDDRPTVDVMDIIREHGKGIPQMMCGCGLMLSWAEWPEHWRLVHVPR